MAAQNIKEPVCVRLLLDDCSFGAPCSCEHDSGGEADPQVLLLQAQQLGTVLQRLTRLVLDDTATWKTRRRAKIRAENHGSRSEVSKVFTGTRWRFGWGGPLTKILTERIINQRRRSVDSEPSADVSDGGSTSWAAAEKCENFYFQVIRLLDDVFGRRSEFFFTRLVHH